ncbi:cyclin-L1-1 [Silene latifolia]|uniref:cyclin-L1-1 n=1 Tax=Silene latifolia TaxID=37657 RepID=UPI003D78227E
MIYTVIDNFYLTKEQLENSPSRKDGIDEETETMLRIYGCDLIQESGILLRLPQAVMATGQVLFHRFYCKKSFACFDVKTVAASCIWLASKLEESPRRAEQEQVIIVFHRMECRRENLSIEPLDVSSKKYADLKVELVRTERHLLKEMGFICHVEHPHKFISNYLATLGTPSELRQDAWNLANDSLRTTLCVRFKSEVVACGVVYAAARRFGVPLPENPPWWKVFDADKSSIDEVCRVLAHLYSRPKAKYLPVCKQHVSSTASSKTWDSQTQSLPKEGSLSTPATKSDSNGIKIGSVTESGGSKDLPVKQAPDRLKGSKKSDDMSKDTRRGTSGERSKDREKEREKERERDSNKEQEKGDLRELLKSQNRDRGRESDREREQDDADSDRDKVKEKSHRSRDRAKDSGWPLDKPKHHSSRDRDRGRDYYYSSRDKDRYRHH